MLTIKQRLEVAPPSLDNNLSDMDRVNMLLRANLGIQQIIWPLDILKILSNTLRSSDGIATATLKLHGENLSVLTIEPGDTTGYHFGLAVDLGTTVVAAELIDLNTGNSLAAMGGVNGQVQYGEDLLSRLHFSAQGGLDKLHAALLNTVNALVKKICDSTGVLPQQISAFCAAGNTSMTHFLLGIDPSTIRREPYAPILTQVPEFVAKDIGIDILPNASCYIFPSVGSFLGGDLIAGALAAHIDEGDDISLLLDIGTNGEMILGNKDWLLAGAGAAGPALEGGVAECAKRAEPGAIERVKIDPSTLEPSCNVIGDVQATGLCGSGLIDTIAELYINGLLDSTGRFAPEKKTPSWQEVNGRTVYTLVRDYHKNGSPLVYITEKDIQNVLRTKAAMVAALTILLDSVGLDIESISRIYTAGSFGIHLSVDSTTTVGLYPKLPTERFVQLGNGSLRGAKEILLDPKKIADANRIAEKITYLELNIHPAFMGIFRSAKYID